MLSRRGAGGANSAEFQISDLPALKEFDISQSPRAFAKECERLFADQSISMLRGENSVCLFHHADLVAMSQNPLVGNSPASRAIKWVLDRPEYDPGSGSSVGRNIVRFYNNMFFTTNPPIHDPLKRMFLGNLLPKAIARLGSHFEQVAATNIERFAEQGVFDFASEFVPRVSAAVFEVVFGLTREEAEKVVECVNTFTRKVTSGSNEDFRAADEAVGRLMGVMEGAGERHLSARGDNIYKSYKVGLDRIVFDGEGDFAGYVPENVGLFLAGGAFHLHASAGLISSTVYSLLQLPQVLELVRADSSLIPAAIAETARLHSPVGQTSRFARKDLVFKDVFIPRGTEVLMNWEVGNRDPKRFEEPSAFRLHRPRDPDITFGGGTYACPGRHLTGLLTHAVVKQLLTGGVRLEIAEEGDFWPYNCLMRVIPRLPLMVARR